MPRVRAGASLTQNSANDVYNVLVNNPYFAGAYEMSKNRERLTSLAIANRLMYFRADKEQYIYLRKQRIRRDPRKDKGAFSFPVTKNFKIFEMNIVFLILPESASRRLRESLKIIALLT